MIDTTGKGFTTNEALPERAELQGLVKSARKILPLSLRLAVNV